MARNARGPTKMTPTIAEVAELICKVVIAVAALLTAIKWW